MRTYVSSTSYQQPQVSLITWLTRRRSSSGGASVGVCVFLLPRLLKIQRNPLILWALRSKDNSAQRMRIWEGIISTSMEDLCSQVALGQRSVGQSPLLWMRNLKCPWRGLPDAIACDTKKLDLTIQEAFSSPKSPCKYAQIFFYKVLNNFFAFHGFLSTSYILWFWLFVSNLFKLFLLFLHKTRSSLSFQPQLFQGWDFYHFLVVPDFLHSWSFQGAFSVEHPVTDSFGISKQIFQMKGHFLLKNWKRAMVTLCRDNGRKAAEENNLLLLRLQHVHLVTGAWSVLNNKKKCHH